METDFWGLGNSLGGSWLKINGGGNLIWGVGTYFAGVGAHFEEKGTHFRTVRFYSGVVGIHLGEWELI